MINAWYAAIPIIICLVSSLFLQDLFLTMSLARSFLVFHRIYPKRLEAPYASDAIYKTGNR